MQNEKTMNLSEMKCYYFDLGTVNDFLGFLKTKAQLFAPHKKGEASYVYKAVENTNDVVLEYNRTIQPLKKFFLPAKEKLLSFNLTENNFKTEVVEAENRIFFGIHSYEMQGVKRLDYSFLTGNPESNYLTRRENSLFIGISYQPDEYHFSKAVGIEIEDTDGFSLYFEKTGNGYFVFLVDEKGATLVKEFGKGKLIEEPYNLEEKKYNQKIKLHYNRLPQVFDHVYNSKVWDEVAERCVGCGTCNLLCSTCYCFDVRDEVEIDATTGSRNRFWDGCMLNTFAEVAGNENFREKLSNRTRHRLHRKFKYITDTSGELHCVGCGRCSKFCPADINIIDIINDLIDDYATQQKKQII
jgi:sulfhydrogenase subunit beta (sulfur reductase)